MLNDSMFVTDDVMLVSILALHGVRPDVSEPVGRQWRFKFVSTPFLHEVVEQFTRGTMTVNARMLALIYKDNVTQLRRQSRGSIGVVESRQ